MAYNLTAVGLTKPKNCSRLQEVTYAEQ